MYKQRTIGLKIGFIYGMVILSVGLLFVIEKVALSAPNDGTSGGGGPSSVTNAITQLDSNVTVTDIGVGGRVEITADAKLFVEVKAATNEVLIGVADVTINDNTIIRSNMTVNGVVTADGFTATQDDGARGANFNANLATPYTCTANTDEFDIFADSSGVLDDTPLWCDQTTAVREFASHGVRGAANPRLSVTGVDDAVQLKLVANPGSGTQTANILEIYDSGSSLSAYVNDTGELRIKTIASNQGTGAEVPWIMNATGKLKVKELKFRGEYSSGTPTTYFDSAKILTTVTNGGAATESADLVISVPTGGALTNRLAIPADTPVTIKKGTSVANSGIEVESFVGSGSLALIAPDITSGAETHVMRHKTVSHVTASGTVPNSAFRNGYVIADTTGMDAATTAPLVLDLPVPSTVGVGAYVCIVSRFGAAELTEKVEIKPDPTSIIYTVGTDDLLIKDGLETSTRGGSLCLVATDATTWQTLNRKGGWARVAH